MPQAGRALWRRLAPELHAAGLLTVLDLPLLEAFCAAYSRWRAAESAIAELGLTAPSARGSPRPRAEVSIALRERAAMLAAGAALGIGAGARSRMLIEPPPPAPGLLEELLRPVPTGARVELDDLVDEDEDEEPGDEPDGGTAA
jgi:P27 family predicted phage terminase small subunit